MHHLRTPQMTDQRWKLLQRKPMMYILYPWQFLGWPWSTEQAEERDEEVNTFLRTQDITSTV